MIDLPFTQLEHLFDSSNGFINCASDMQDPWFWVVLVGTCRYQFWRYGSARCLGGRVSARCVNTRITHGLARLVASLTRYSGCTQMVGKKTLGSGLDSVLWLCAFQMAILFSFDTTLVFQRPDEMMADDVKGTPNKYLFNKARGWENYSYPPMAPEVLWACLTFDG